MSADSYRALLATYLGPRRGGVFVLGILLVAGVSLQLASPQIVRFFVDTAQAGGAVEALLVAAGLYLGAAVLANAVTVAETYAAEQVGWGATNALRLDLVRHALRLDMAFHDARTPGELIERIDGDVAELANFFSRFVLRLLGSALMLLGALALLFAEDWRLGLLFLGTCAVALVVLEKVRAAGTRFATVRRQANAELFGFLEERLAGIVDLQANGAAGHVMARLRDRVAEVFHTSRTAFLMGSVLSAAAGSVFLVGTVAVLALGAYLYGAGVLSLGAVYVVLQYTAMIRQNLGEIQRQARDFQAAEASIKRVRELAALRPTVLDGPVELPAGALSVELRDVSFAYRALAPPPVSSSPLGFPLSRARERGPGGEGPPLALADLSLQLAPGRVLGVLGRTGSGKSTLGRLLARLYDPREGAVLLGGVDLRQARLDSLRRRIGVVTQEVQLFRASLKENVTLFDDSISDERALAALDELGLGEWARARGGLEAELDPGGLSAGEAQLLQLSRVFLKDPGLVVLDEASSRLDPATERLLDRAVERLLTGRTAIVIAHRLGTIDRADDVLVLERGRVVEHAPRATLAADPTSRFADLLAADLAPAREVREEGTASPPSSRMPTPALSAGGAA